MSEPQREMPRYKCHKEVHALKIKAIVPDPAGYRIEPEEDGYAPLLVDATFVRKHNPHIGGYYVVYEDGYRSFSPAKAFEEGYARV